MGMGFAPTWLRRVSPPASQNHFSHCTDLNCAGAESLRGTCVWGGGVFNFSCNNSLVNKVSYNRY